MPKGAKNSASARNGRDSRQSGDGHRRGDRNRLRKRDILRGYSAFSRVLSSGRTLSLSPIRLFIRQLPRESGRVVVGFAVSRTVRSSVKRNRARRLMREAYRRSSTEWAARTSGPGVEAVWMYVGDPGTPPRFAEVETAIRGLMKKALSRLP